MRAVQMSRAKAFALGASLLILHKVESYFAGEFDVDPSYAAVARMLADPHNVFVALVVTLGLIFVLVYLSAVGGRKRLLVFILAGLLFSHEIHHLIRSVIQSSYYPGTVTGTLCFLYSIFYWRNLFSRQ